MLNKITLKNVALVKNLELDFTGGLNILSGETGAGKSILVDALMLLLGGKYDKTILRHGADDGFVEGIFDFTDRLGEVLDEFGFEKDEQLIVLRKFNSSGKTEIRLNGRSCTTLVLSRIMSSIVDIYGQNEYQSLAQKSMHLKILDGFLKGQASTITLKLKELFSSVLLINKELKKIGDESERARQVDLIRFSLKEIAKASIGETEEEELLSRRKIISSGEKIAQSLGETAGVLSAGEPSVLALLDNAKHALGAIEGYSSGYSELFERLNSCFIELDDISSGVQGELEGLEFDPQELEKIEQRLDIIRTLKRKYGSFSDMQKFVAKNEALLDTLENGAENFEKLTKQKTKLLDEAFSLATKLSSIRQDGAKKLEDLILRELSDLGMAGAVFNIEFGDKIERANFEKHFSASGIDSPEFYFSANLGQPAKPLVKIISGGELSRFMLALKVVSASVDDIPTMIFDEVDTGISGKIGQEVAKKLASIAAFRQVLCVTHLPQIASMADSHFFIEKKAEGGETQTTVRLLDKNGEIEEISRLSGAKDISNTATANASQMKSWSSDFKKEIKNKEAKKA